jgi:hypothetical protein
MPAQFSTCNSGKPKINPTYQNCRIDEEYFQASRNPLKLSFLSFSTEFFQPLKDPLKLSFFLHRICSKRKDPLNLPLFLSYLHRICSIKKEDPLKVSFFLHRICSILKEPTQAFLLSSPDFFKKKEDPLKVSFFLHRICSILEERTQAFVLLSSPDLFKKKEDPPLKHSFLFTGFVLSSSCSFNSTSHSPKKLHKNLRLQSQNLS